MSRSQLNLSKAVQEAMQSDAVILDILDRQKNAYLSGKKIKLLQVCFVCARVQAVIPEWAVDALLHLETELTDGTVTDLNEAFGWKPEHGNKRKARLELDKVEVQIFDELVRRRQAAAKTRIAEARKKSGENDGADRRIPAVEDSTAEIALDSAFTVITFDAIVSVFKDQGVAISRTQVEKIYQRHKVLLQAIPQHGVGTEVDGVSHTSLGVQLPRRRNRPILENAQ